MAPRDDSTLTTQIKKTATGLVLPWLTFAFAALRRFPGWILEEGQEKY